MQKYGHFSKDGREFIITRPDTPAPWVNYISNGRYCGIISHTAGGYSFYLSPRDGRISRWRYNSLPADRPGRYVILRDRNSGEYWSPTWQPTFTPLDYFQCRHGMYYTIISSRYNHIDASIRYFVPGDDLEIWQVTLKNKSRKRLDLDVFSFVELCLGHALVDLINQPNDQHFNETFFDGEAQILHASKRYWARFNGPTVNQSNEEWDRHVIMSSTLPVKGFDGSRETFIGRWRSEENPVAIERGECFNTETTFGDAVGALQMEVSLAADEEIRFATLLGVVPKQDHRENARRLVEKYRDAALIDAEFTKLNAFWQGYLQGVQVKTADAELNTMVNVWNQYQTSVTYQFSRNVSYYHGGLLFGRGYRDSCQDILGPALSRPEWVRERIREMCGYQFSAGNTYHLYYPHCGGGECTGHSDTQLWLPLAIIAYLKETGELDFLDDEVDFHDGGSASIFEHLKAALRYSLANLSGRYLAKFGPGDWNDTLDYLGREGRGETVWGTMFLAYILRESAELCAAVGAHSLSEEYRREYRKVSDAVNRYCWDGEWYIRGTNDRGEVIGSVANAEGKIFLNTQSWAVISGVAPDERAVCCMNAAERHLDTAKGPKLLHPPYRTIDKNIGLITRCVPGKKENGAVFNHAVSWAILAECLLGRGDRAYELYRKSLPMNRDIDIDRYQVEPYVYAEYVTSPDHPSYGQGSHSWLTGSSAWMLRDAVDYLLGIRATYRGLLIEPCIPKQWRHYEVTRRYRGRSYHIQVRNPDGVSRGVRSIAIDGTAIAGNLIDLQSEEIASVMADRSQLNVAVTMG